MPQKLSDLLKSRKFWALVSAIVATVLGMIYGGVTVPAGIQAIVAALAAYMIGTGLDVNTNGPTPPAAIN